MPFANRVTGGWPHPVALDFKLRANLGDHVRVCSGVFEDVEGTIVGRLGGSRVVLAVDLTQTGISLEIDECQIEIVN